MSYRDPKQVIDNRVGIISQGVGKMMARTTEGLNSYTAQKQKEHGLYKKQIEKASSAAKSSLDTQYQAAIAQKNKFTEGLYGKSGEKTEEAIKFDTQIEEILGGWGTELNESILEIQKRGGTADEIMRAKNDAITKMNKFTGDIANWEAARQEYMIAKEKGTLLSDPENQRNVDLINMFEAATDDELDNLYITHDENGNTRISLGTITDGVFDAQSSKDISAWAKANGDQGENGYFEENIKFDKEDYKIATDAFTAIEENEDLWKDGVLDQERALDYLINDETGRTMVNAYLQGDSINKWESLFEGDRPTYSEEAYLEKVLGNAWNDLYAPKHKRSPKENNDDEDDGFNYELEDKDGNGVPDYMEVNKDKDGNVIPPSNIPGFDPDDLWPSGVPKP